MIYKLPQATMFEICPLASHGHVIDGRPDTSPESHQISRNIVLGESNSVLLAISGGPRCVCSETCPHSDVRCSIL